MKAKLSFKHFTFVCQLIVLAVVCTSCKPSVSYTGYSWQSATNLMGYSCDIVRFERSGLFSSATNTAVLISRVLGKSTDSFIEFEYSGGKAYVDGSILRPPASSVVYYKTKGRLMSQPITNSGIWSAFFTREHPTDAEMDRAFGELDRQNQLTTTNLNEGR